jgi:hypothetical protein
VNIKYRSYSLSKFNLSKGNLYDYINEDTMCWLIDEAISHRVDNLGIIIASILKDAHHEDTNSS